MWSYAGCRRAVESGLWRGGWLTGGGRVGKTKRRISADEI